MHEATKAQPQSLVQGFVAGALIGLGGAEFRLPVQIGLFGFLGLLRLIKYVIIHE